MKKCRFLLSIVILAITFNSCQKGGTSFRGAVMGNGNPQLAQIIAAKRAFYKNLSTEPGSLTTQTTGGKGFNHIKSLEKISRWDKAYSIRVSGHDIVVRFVCGNSYSPDPPVRTIEIRGTGLRAIRT